MSLVVANVVEDVVRCDCCRYDGCDVLAELRHDVDM